MGALTFSVPDTELSLTVHNRMSDVVDQIFKQSATLFAFRNRGGVRTLDGGYSIVQPVRMAKNTSTGSFSGFDILDTTPQDTETSAVWPWAETYATIAVAWDETQRNKGRGKLIDLVMQKTDDAGATIRDKLNTYLTATPPSAGSKDPISIQEVIQTDPTTNPARTASIGALSDANTWWRNKATSGGAFTVSDMNTMFNDVSDGVEPPSCLLTNQTVFEYYENSQVGLQRYTDMAMADAGFMNLAYKTKPIFYDPNIGLSGAIYFLNFQYLKLTMMAGADFISTDFIEPDNQAAKVAKILWMGNLTCTQRRRQGVLFSITAPA